MVVSGSAGGRLRLWNVKEGSMVGDPWKRHSAPVTCLDLSPDGREIVSGSEDGTVRRWNIDTGRQIAPPIETDHRSWSGACRQILATRRQIRKMRDNNVICVWRQTRFRVVVAQPLSGTPQYRVYITYVTSWPFTLAVFSSPLNTLKTLAMARYGELPRVAEGYDPYLADIKQALEEPFKLSRAGFR
ncbi:hypothetical protein M405DRAFT_878754 [Rhizopogon salebrosus TDB-379]|nr:hypothetical protein M405DRAFT_878754 [Rhizopogon salebrosus TDB-379]